MSVGILTHLRVMTKSDEPPLHVAQHAKLGCLVVKVEGGFTRGLSGMWGAKKRKIGSRTGAAPASITHLLELVGENMVLAASRRRRDRASSSADITDLSAFCTCRLTLQGGMQLRDASED